MHTHIGAHTHTLSLYRALALSLSFICYVIRGNYCVISLRRVYPAPPRGLDNIGQQWRGNNDRLTTSEVYATHTHTHTHICMTAIPAATLRNACKHYARDDVIAISRNRLRNRPTNGTLRNVT